MREGIKQVRAVERSLQILHLFLVRSVSLGVAETARMTGLPKSTVYRIMLTMEEAGFLARTGEEERFQRGPRLLGALLQPEAPDLRQIVRSVAENLRDTCGETVGFHLLEGNERVCILAAEGKQTLRTSGRVGSRAPLHSGASSRAILAFLPPERQQALLTSELVPLTSHTLTDPVQLEQELARIRCEGFAISHSEWEEGISSVAAPVFGPSGVPLGSLNLSGPAFRLTRERIDGMVQALKIAADQVSRKLRGEHVPS